jgi:hypothetical protein
MAGIPVDDPNRNIIHRSGILLLDEKIRLRIFEDLQDRRTIGIGKMREIDALYPGLEETRAIHELTRRDVVGRRHEDRDGEQRLRVFFFRVLLLAARHRQSDSTAAWKTDSVIVAFA